MYLKIALFLSLAVVCTLAQTTVPVPHRPHISDDFTAEVDLTEEHGSHTLAFSGMLYESFSTRRQRIDVEIVHEKQVHLEILRFYKTQIQYEIEGAAKDCKKLSLNMTMEPAFNWVKQANYSQHTCQFRFEHNVMGNLWVHQNDYAEAALCVSKTDANTPYWMEFRPIHRREARSIHFHTFIPGSPPDTTFTVPNTCPSM